MIIVQTPVVKPFVTMIYKIQAGMRILPNAPNFDQK